MLSLYTQASYHFLLQLLWVVCPLYTEKPRLRFQKPAQGHTEINDYNEVGVELSSTTHGSVVVLTEFRRTGTALLNSGQSKEGWGTEGHQLL